MKIFCCLFNLCSLLFEDDPEGDEVVVRAIPVQPSEAAQWWEGQQLAQGHECGPRGAGTESSVC